MYGIGNISATLTDILIPNAGIGDVPYVSYDLGKTANQRKRNNVSAKEFAQIFNSNILNDYPVTPLKIDIKLPNGGLYTAIAKTLEDAQSIAYKEYVLGNPFFIRDDVDTLVLMFDYDSNGKPYFANEHTYMLYMPKNIDYQTQEKFTIKKRRLPKGEPFLSNKQAAAKKAYDNAHKIKPADVFRLYTEDSPRLHFAAEKVAEHLFDVPLTRSNIINVIDNMQLVMDLPGYQVPSDDEVLETIKTRIVDGLGKPTIKLEFETNSELADFLSSNKQNKQYAPYTDVTATETPAANAKAKSKIRNGILMPADDSRTFPEPPAASALPPTKTPPPLPTAPTAKALPEYKGHAIGVVLNPLNVTPVKYTFADGQDTTLYKADDGTLYTKFTLYDDLPYLEDFSYDEQTKILTLKWKYLILISGIKFYPTEYPEINYTFVCPAYNVEFLARNKWRKIMTANVPYVDYIKYFYDNTYKVFLREFSKKKVNKKLVSDLEILLQKFKNQLDVVTEGQPPATNEPPVVKFTPKKPKQKKPEIEFDNITYITRGMPAIIMDVPQSSISSKTYLNDWWNFAERKYHYPDDIVTFVQIEDKDNGTHYSKYYQFFFKNRDKDFVLRNIRNKKNIILKDDFFIVTKLADIERIEDALLNDGNRHLVIIKPLIYDDGLGKPTIKLEFEDNADLMSLFDTDGISGFTVNDKPADIFNCPESALQTQGYKPTYRRLPDYSHLIDTADGRKTLKGYGFDSATLDELINACKHYPQVARLADHLKDPAGDPLQSAFNVWHWLHTNIRYAYDTPGEEEIRTPARVWADRESGVDCDCLAVMTACLLLNMGLNPKFEIVAFNDEPTFSHIYVNLDGAAIDRVLPVFLARPDHITKTQIMDIPVYQLSGIGGCDALSGVYSSTLAKLQQGTATGEDINDFRKTQVLVTLRGIDDAAYSLAALLMPHVVTIADDGTYYFDSTAMAQLATKLDHDLANLISSNADADTISQWIAAAAKQIDGASSVTSNGGDDTIVVIINPKGATTRVIGQMVKSQTDTLTPLTQTATATDTAAQTYAQSATPAIMQTSAMPGVSPDGDTANEESDSNNWLWIAGIAAAFGIGAAVASNKKKRR